MTSLIPKTLINFSHFLKWLFNLSLFPGNMEFDIVNTPCSADKAKHFALFVYDMVFKPWEAFFPRWIKSSLALSALLNAIAFLFTGTFSFGRFPFLHGGASKFVKNRSIFTIASSARRSCDRFKCEAMCKASQHC